MEGDPLGDFSIQSYNQLASCYSTVYLYGSNMCWNSESLLRNRFLFLTCSLLTAGIYLTLISFLPSDRIPKLFLSGKCSATVEALAKPMAWSVRHVSGATMVTTCLLPAILALKLADLVDFLTLVLVVSLLLNKLHQLSPVSISSCLKWRLSSGELGWGLSK